MSSVGKISLDLEVQSDLQGQINKVSSNIAKGLKNSLQGATKGIFDGLENGIKKTTGNINKTVGNSMSNLKKSMQSTLSAFSNIKIKAPEVKFKKNENETATFNPVQDTKSYRGPPVGVNLEKLSSQISNTEKTLDNINARIEQQQEKLAKLRESYNRAFDGAKKNRLGEQMLKTEATINRLIGQSDKLGFKLAELDDKYASMKAMSNSVAGEGTGKLNKSISNISKAMNNASTGGNRLKNIFKGLSNTTKSANNSFRGASNSLSIFAGTMLKWGIIFPIIQRGITAMAKGLYNNLMTNQAFANSLAQIKTNLMVAFTPIYYAILPAINALMSALSTITGMIASFTSAIFGTTYKASLGATQGLIDAKDAMGAYGDSAKKTVKDIKGILAPFDEINQLQSNSSDNGGGGAGGGSDKPVLAPVDTSPYDNAMKGLADRLKLLMGPILNAWAKEGQNTINAIKYALSSIWELIKSIGRSFEEVWLSTGEETCTLILQILQNIFNIIGDITTAFNNAWNNNNIGTKIVQRLWNSFNNLLYIIKGVGDVFRNAFGGLGQSVVDHFMDVLYSLSGLIEKVTNNLRWIWDNGGSYCFGKLIEFSGRVFNILADIINDSLVPIAEFITDTLTPVINALLDVIGWLFDKVNELLTWLDGDGNGILTAVVDTLLSFALAWEVLKIGISLFNGLQTVMALVTSATTLLSGAIAFLQSPFGLITLAIGGVILIGYQLYKHWDELSAKAKEVWDSIQNKFNEFKDWLGNVFATDWSQRFGFLGEVLNSFLANIRNIWDSIKQVLNGVIDFVVGIFSGNWSRAWQGVVSIFGGIMGGLSSVVKAPLNAVIGIINGAISGINSIHIDIPSWVPGLGGRSFGPHISRIPYLAKGGIVDQPTLAMVGEAGKEAVMPLENNTGWISNLAGKIASQLPPGETKEKQPVIINIYQNGVLTTTKVIDDINDITKANGGVCPINI